MMNQPLHFSSIDEFVQGQIFTECLLSTKHCAKN